MNLVRWEDGRRWESDDLGWMMDAMDAMDEDLI
jgi:hypothetical protein